MKRTDYKHIGRKRHPVNAAFWQKSYVNDDAFWDHGKPVPGLVDFLKRKSRYIPGTVLVPGCGRGHDCRELARHGFTVTGLDISPQAMAEARQLLNDEPIRYIAGNFLKPTRRRYDWIFEHTCFCAIDPAFRNRYVRAAQTALKPGGHLLGVFYNIQPKTGPPFGTTREELVERFSRYFSLIADYVPRSYSNRKGKELLMLWRKL